jgi:T4 superinfection immunity protein
MLMQALAASGVLWVLLFPLLGVLYFLPTLTGLLRGVNTPGLVFMFNLIGAPTGVGWLGAMILAFGPRQLPPSPPL